jgi:hypothetical protein
MYIYIYTSIYIYMYMYPYKYIYKNKGNKNLQKRLEEKLKNKKLLENNLLDIENKLLGGNLNDKVI